MKPPIIISTEEVEVDYQYHTNACRIVSASNIGPDFYSFSYQDTMRVHYIFLEFGNNTL